jgi:hypothetical protein
MCIICVRIKKQKHTKNSQKNKEKIIKHSLPRRAADDDDASATWPTEPSRRGRRRQRYCRGARAVAGVGRRTRCCRGRRAAASGFEREATINMLLGGGACGKARGWGGGTSSATAAVVNDVPRASRSAAAGVLRNDGRSGVRRRGGGCGDGRRRRRGAAMMPRWRPREQVLDGAMRSDAGWRRTR